MLKHTRWLLLVIFCATPVFTQQTIFWKKDHIYNGPSGKEIAVIMPQPTDQTAPTAPTGLTAGTVTANSVQLSWSASTDSGGSGLAGYKVYRQQASNANLPVGTVGPGTLSFTDQGPLVPSTPYTYTIVAYDNAENHSSPSSSVAVTTSTLNNSTAPTAPANLTGYVVSRNSVQLTWNRSVDTGGSGLAGYMVYRGGTLISGTTPIPTPTYLDANLAYNTTYSYTVTAIDNSNNVSSPSSPFNITTGRQLLFQDTFNRADGALGTPWTFNLGAGAIDLYNDYTPGGEAISQLQVAGAACPIYSNCQNMNFGTYYYQSGGLVGPYGYPIIVWQNAALQPSQNTFQATVSIVSNNSYAGILFYTQATTGGFNDPGGGGYISYPSANGYRAVLENGGLLVQSCTDLSYPINTTDVCTTVASATGMPQTGTLSVQTNAVGTVIVYVNGTQALSFSMLPSRMTGGVGMALLSYFDSNYVYHTATLGTFVLESN